MFQTISFFNSFLAIIAGSFVLASNPKSKKNILYFCLSVSIALYAIFFAVSIFSTSPHASLIEIKIFHAILCFLAVFTYLFMHEIVFENAFKKLWHLFPFFIAGIASYFCLFGDVVSAVKTVGGLPHWTVPGNQFYIYLLHYGLFTQGGLIILVYGYLNSTFLKKDQIRLVLIGSFISLMGAWTTFLPGWGIDIEPYGIHFIFIFHFMVGFSILKYQMFHIKTTLSRFWASVITLLILGLFVTFSLYFYGILVGYQTFNFPLIIFSLFIGLLAGAFFHKTTALLQTTLQKTFIKGWHNPTDTLHILSKNLQKRYSREDILKTVANTLMTVLEIEQCHLLILETHGDKTSTQFLFTDFSAKVIETISAHNPFIEFLSKNPHPISLRMLPSELKSINFLQSMSKNGFALPLSSPERLEGILIFGQRASECTFSEEDFTFFKTAQFFINAILHSTLPYENLEEIVKTQLEFQGIFKTVVTMSHEINSPLTSLMLGLTALKGMYEGGDKENQLIEALLEAAQRISEVIKRMQQIKKPQDTEYLAGVRMIDIPRE